jgi:hypothetical protein
MTQLVRPSRRQLVGEIVDVLRDLPVLITAPLYRRWHLHWGATPDETRTRLPGDSLTVGARYRSTRAVTIDAPPRAVWPWLVQVGCPRAGFYSNDLVHSYVVDEWLLWTKPDSTWVWRLTPTAEGGTRLVTRIRTSYDWTHPATALMGVVLMEFGDFAMLRKMLRGIKQRAESLPDFPVGAGFQAEERPGR